jgi:basic membrane lipoprotein Med (substrate-binding protein (PBP1-ABC) superfamily)
MLDQHDEAPGTVITSVVWDMWPLVKYVITSVRSGSFVAMDLREWTMMAKGGAYLAPFREFEEMIPEDLKQEIEDITERIKMGMFRVPIDETMPTSD